MKADLLAQEVILALDMALFKAPMYLLALLDDKPVMMALNWSTEIPLPEEE
jgi:hypothetical protein